MTSIPYSEIETRIRQATVRLKKESQIYLGQLVNLRCRYKVFKPHGTAVNPATIDLQLIGNY